MLFVSPILFAVAARRRGAQAGLGFAVVGAAAGAGEGWGRGRGSAERGVGGGREGVVPGE